MVHGSIRASAVVYGSIRCTVVYGSIWCTMVHGSIRASAVVYGTIRAREGCRRVTSPRQRVAGAASSVGLRRCCCMQAYISCTHGACRQPQKRSPSSSGRQMSHARVGGDN